MRKTILGILTLALVLAAAPAAQAENTDQYGWAYLFAGQAALLSVDAGPNAVVFTLHDITISDQMAADARTAIDNMEGVGDRDGQVTESEVVGAEAFLQSAINSVLPTQFDFDMITIDGKSAYSEEKKIHMQALDIKGAVGPVTSTDTIQTDAKLKLAFDSVDQSSGSHTVRFENLYGDFSGHDVSDSPPVEIQVSGFSSWAIDSASIAPSEFSDRLADDTLTFQNADIAYFDEQGEGLEFVIKGDPSVKVSDETKGSPAVGPLAFVTVLGALLVALRRRF